MKNKLFHFQIVLKEFSSLPAFFVFEAVELRKSPNNCECWVSEAVLLSGEHETGAFLLKLPQKNRGRSRVGGLWVVGCRL